MHEERSGSLPHKLLVTFAERKLPSSAELVIWFLHFSVPLIIVMS